MGDGRKNPTNEIEQRERDVRNAVLNALRHKLTGRKAACFGGCRINGPVVFETGNCINCEADRVMGQGHTDPRDAISYVRTVYKDPPLSEAAGEPFRLCAHIMPMGGGMRCPNQAVVGRVYCREHVQDRPGLTPPAPSLEQLRSEGRQAPLLDRAELPNINAIYGKLGAPDEDWYYPEGSWIPVRRPKLISRATFAEAGEIASLRAKLSTAQGALTKYMKERASLADEATMLRAENKTLSADCNTLRRKLEDAERKLAARGKR